MKPMGITRVRNEASIIADTIYHFLEYCNHIILYDDCSEDDTVALARQAGKGSITIIQGRRWITDRVAEETRHRDLLLHKAARLGAEWCLYFDADERLIGNLPKLKGDGFRFRLFDGYMTQSRQVPYDYCRRFRKLVDLKRMWGPEYRDILMLFRTESSRYIGLDQREPVVHGSVSLADIKVKHFGKCLSVEHWEETCDYYATYFPKRYKQKWLARKGKAIHTHSDFGRELLTWQELIDHSDKWIKL